MNNLTQTKKEQDENLSRYKLNLLKKIKNIENSKKLAKASQFDTDLLFEKKKSNVFGSYVDFIAVKGFITDTLSERLKLNKSLVVDFISKLSKDEIYILSSNIQDFLKFVKNKNPNAINDYILKTSFTTFRNDYEKQERDKEDNKTKNDADEEAKDAVEEVTGQPAEAVTGQQAEEVVEAIPVDEAEERQKAMDYFKIFIISELNNLDEAVQTTSRQVPRTKLYYSVIDFLKNRHKEYSRFTLIQGRPTVKKILTTLTDDVMEYIDEFETEYIKDKATEFLTNYNDVLNFQLDALTGTPAGLSEPVKTPSPKKQQKVDKFFQVGKGFYKPLGKYYIKDNRLSVDNVLQVRSGAGVQVAGIAPIRVSNTIKVVLEKISDGKSISYEDIVKLNEDEQDELYEIAKRMKITELMNLPSKIKNKDQQLKDEFNLLRGEIISGQDSPATIKKFKLVLYKLKTGKLISIHEYNEMLNMLMELGY